MKKLFLFICILLIPISLFSQRKFKDGIIVEDTTDVESIKFPDGSVLTTAMLSGDSTVYPTDSAELKGNIRELLARTDTAQELVSRTIYVSMPTDPQTPGSDVTGNGSISLPYATPLKALESINLIKLSNITITIQLDSGQFIIGDKEIGLYNYYNLTGFKNVKFQGVTQNVYTSVTGSNSGTDRFNFNCTSHIFTVNELQGLFGYTGTVYYPIESNTSTVISRAGTGTTMPTIVRLNTTIQFTTRWLSFNNNFFGTQFGLTFNLCKITFSLTQNKFISGVTFTNCHITTNGNSGYLQIADNGAYFDACYITSAMTSTSLFILNGYLLLTNSVAYSTGNRVINGISIGPHGIGKNITLASYGCIYTNMLLGYLFRSAMVFQTYSTTAYPQKFKNCQTVFGKTSASANNLEIYYRYGDLYTESCDYLLINDNGPIRFDVKNLYGTLNNGYINTSSLSTSFINLQIGQIINIPGIYPEYQQRQSVTLANNSTDSISIADLTYNRTIELKINLVRGTDYQTKTLKLLNTGSTYNFVQLGDSIQTGDLGVRFDGVYRSGSSNTLKLRWHTTNTGAAATLTYDAYRQNF